MVGMNRRDFCKFLSLTVAGAAILPAQAQAFEHYFDVNCPPGEGPFVAVDEIMLFGMASVSTPIVMTCHCRTLQMQMGINAFGGIMRWSAGPLQTIMAELHDFWWEFQHPRVDEFHSRDMADLQVRDALRGHVSYVDSTGLRHLKSFDRARDSLAGGNHVSVAVHG